MAYLIMKQIQTIYWEEEKQKNFSSEERFMQYQVVSWPLVDALFVYLKQHDYEASINEKLCEIYLCVESGTLSESVPDRW